MKMRINFLMSLCFIFPFALKGVNLAEQLYNAQLAVQELQKAPTVKNIDEVIRQIESLLKTQEPMTEDQKIEILDLGQERMFLKTLRKYIQVPSDKDFSLLESWVQKDSSRKVFLERIMGRN